MCRNDHRAKRLPSSGFGLTEMTAMRPNFSHFLAHGIDHKAAVLGNSTRQSYS